MSQSGDHLKGTESTSNPYKMVYVPISLLPFYKPNYIYPGNNIKQPNVSSERSKEDGELARDPYND